MRGWQMRMNVFEPLYSICEKSLHDRGRDHNHSRRRTRRAASLGSDPTIRKSAELSMQERITVCSFAIMSASQFVRFCTYRKNEEALAFALLVTYLLEHHACERFSSHRSRRWRQRTGEVLANRTQVLRRRTHRISRAAVVASRACAATTARAALSTTNIHHHTAISGGVVTRIVVLRQGTFVELVGETTYA